MDIPGECTARELIGAAARGLRFVALLFSLCSPSALADYPFTLDFESGDLRGWTATGKAFSHQPTLGDNPMARGRGQSANQQGSYWIGTYEQYQGRTGEQAGNTQGDGPTGVLSSPWFEIPKGHLSFLVGGGSGEATSVRLNVLNLPPEEFYFTAYSVSGRNSETMVREHWDLTRYAGRQGQLMIVDNASGAWGHINADDFRFEPLAAVVSPQPAATALWSHANVDDVQPAPAVAPPPQVVVPNVLNIPLDQAQQRLRQLRIKGRVIGRLPSAEPTDTVVQQDPLPGEKAASGTVVELLVSDRVALKATPSTHSPEVGKAVSFRLQLLPPPEDTRKEFALRVEGEDTTPAWRLSADPALAIERTFRKGGAVIVVPMARLNGRQVVEGEPLRLKVGEAWQAPRAGIGDAPDRVARGTTLVLRSTSRFDPRNRDPHLSWTVDGVRECSGEECRIETGDSALGEHRVILTVRDDRGLQNRATVVYRVFEVERPTLAIEPSRMSVTEEGKVSFSARWIPRVPSNPAYEWRLDGRLYAIREVFTIATRDLANGSHRISLSATAAGNVEQVATAILELRIDRSPPGPPAWVVPAAGASLLVLGFGLMHRGPGRKPRGGRGTPGSVSAVFRPASRIETRLEQLPSEGRDIRLRLAVDCRGEQRVETEHNANNRESSP